LTEFGRGVFLATSPTEKFQTASLMQQPKYNPIAEANMRKLFLAFLLLAPGAALSLTAAERLSVPDVSHLALPGGTIASVDRRLNQAYGEVEIVVRLGDAPLVVAQGEGAKKRGGRMTRAQQLEHVGQLTRKQDELVQSIRTLGGREIARVTKALNAVIFRVDASRIPAIAGMPNVVSIRPVVNYKLDLTETVPYIGAKAVQAAGIDGTGVTVAVIDSGIDYTHKKLGGAGTGEAYEAAYGVDSSDPKNTTTDGLFPTAKVVGGFDFVGEEWPEGDLMPDPDPIDFQGHGTHVADIIGGLNGVAPGVTLYALKGCSAIATSCSGVALLQAMDFALDPNGDGDISDAVDVINMSLGSNYGQREDDLSEASANAVKLGVVVVVAAGNAADRPYIVSSPSTTPEAISVAETQVPGAKRFALTVNSPAAIAGQYRNTETVGWAPIVSGFTGDVVFVGRGCPADSVAPGTPEDKYIGDPTGKVALIDRGGCAVSLKVDRAAKAGAIAVLIGLVAPGDAVSFSFGGGDEFVETLIITQTDADKVKGQLSAATAVNVTVSPGVFVPLIGSMVASSARGPGYSYNAIKPDISAPGASVSAEVGTGDGETAFGGTSGATPMVSGSVALLVQAYPDRLPAEIKALLMNTAETDIQIDPALQLGVLAPITRIGGGEVRVKDALDSKTAAWDAEDLTGSLSFGYHALAENATFKKRVKVRNYSNRLRWYTISSQFRYSNDEASGAVTVEAPPGILVLPNGSASFEVALQVKVKKLPVWNLNGGSLGGSGSLLQGVEFDGFLTLADRTDNVHLAWQVLPHRSADVQPATEKVRLNRNGEGALLLSNKGGAVNGRLEVFSLTGTSPKIRRQFLPGPGDNFAIIDLQSVGARLVNLGDDEFGIQFAINTYGQRAHPNYPAEFDIFIDNNLDGEFDVAVFTSELGGFGATGQNVVSVLNFTEETVTPLFFTDADLNSANAILTAPLADLGLTPETQFRFSAVAFDNYFTGEATDAIEDMVYTPGSPKFVGTGVPETGVPAGGASLLNVARLPDGEAASPSQTGLLLVYRDGRTGQEADSIGVDSRR
jgi:subtilisin family serine protease